MSRAGCGEMSGEHEVRSRSGEYRALFQESWQGKEIKPEERSSRGEVGKRECFYLFVFRRQ